MASKEKRRKFYQILNDKLFVMNRDHVKNFNTGV